MIKCFKTIENFGVYKDFEWKKCVFKKKDGVQTDYYFKKNNLIYGSNYSGKTTLSRIIKSMDTGKVSSHYEKPSFEIELTESGKVLRSNNATDHNFDVRVFNQDFIKENLSFLYDDNSPIKSFLVLGEENTKLENELKNLKEMLGKSGGDNDKPSGLYKDLNDLKGLLDTSKKVHKQSIADKDALLKNKATIDEDSIKKNLHYFGEVHSTIDKTKLERYITESNNEDRLSEEEYLKYRTFIDEEERTTVQKISKINCDYDGLLNKMAQLLSKKVEISEPIQELLNNRILEQWVKQGRDLHKQDDKQCKFCGNTINEELWIKINNHFNKELEGLEAELNSMNNQINSLISSIEAQIPFKFDENKVYSEFRSGIKDIQDNINTNLDEILNNLNKIQGICRLKIEDKHKTISFSPEAYSFEALGKVNSNIELLNEIIVSSNKKTADIHNEKSKAKELLFRHEILIFKEKIDYHALCNNINTLSDELKVADSNYRDKSQEIIGLKDKIKTLELRRSDKTKGADEINKILCYQLGHNSLELKAIQDGSYCHYEVVRNNKTAHNLSEGEKSLIAFCYFVASLDDSDADKLNRIIWIDDPISSLDSDHVFFIYSLIKDRVTSKPKDYKQIFLVTHNLEFLKYCHRVFDEKKAFFIINKKSMYSSIQKMPKYLSEYTSEFNYLFSVIYCCANEEQSDSNYHMFYNFGNSCRKFLEMYTAFKLPDGGKAGSIDKLQSVFKGNVPAVLIDRVNNEYSHLAGSFERGIVPVNRAEIKTCAEQVLNMIKDNDEDQFNSLVESLDL